MKMRNLGLEIAVMLACYIIIALPVASATTVNIRFNGNLMEKVEYDPSNIVNLHVTYVRDPNDISWSNVRIAITLNSASMAHTIKKVYLYKCGSLSPVACLQKTPESFDTYVDTEIAWADISGSSGRSGYPQEGNILLLVKLENPDAMSSWIGLWNTIKRQSYREFLFYDYELSEMDIHAKDANLVGPITSYIKGFNTIPFKWITKAAFDDASSISAIGGNDNDLDSSPPALQSVQPSGKDIAVINKENYFVFPETSSGVAFPITLEQNPDFQCGDGFCKSSLGENSDICCYDCGCPPGRYCDAKRSSPEKGTCKSHSDIDLDVVGIPSAEVSDCSHSFEVGVTAKINNIPSTLSGTLSGSINVAGTPYTVRCTKSNSGLYDCKFTMMPTLKCGSDTTRQIGPNELKLNINYTDGPNQVGKQISETFSTLNIHYDCGCHPGYYCDSGTETCESENAITLGITELTSFLESYTPGDTIDLTAKIFNPPTGTVLVSASAGLNLTNGVVSPGTPKCTGPNEEYEYECKIPFSITGYQDSVNYKFYPNHLSFRITYNDGTSSKTKTLTTEFGPMSIPSQNCGNDVCNADETAENCCQDCGCEMVGEYCDVVRGCSKLSDVTLTAVPYPVEFKDCKTPHQLNLRTTINNAPYGVKLDYKSINVNYQPVAWKFECPTANIGGIYDCQLEIPPLQGCELPYYKVGPNQLTFKIKFPEGDDETKPRTLDLNTTFSDLYVKPVPHIDGKCEPALGENGSTACVDCPCEDDAEYGKGYYCDYDSYTNPGGSCKKRSNVSLVVDSPTTPVHFESCEKINRVSVVMHVDNQPSGMKIENRFASVGGETARYISCKKERTGFLASNYTYNCTIALQTIDECSQGNTYNFSDNSISLVISYENGKKGKVLQTLTSELPDFFITQSIRSMYDIMEEAQADMREVLDKIMALTEETIDILHKCIEMQIMAMMLGLAVTLIMGVVGGIDTGGEAAKPAATTPNTPSSAVTTPGVKKVAVTTTAPSVKAGSKPETGWSFSTEGFAEGMESGLKISEAGSKMADKMCGYLEKMNRIEVKLQEMQLEKIKMETCLAVNQHALDSGRCKGKEESCFDNIVSCLSYISEIKKIRDSIGDDIRSISKDFVEMNEELQDILGEFTDTSSIGKYIRVGVSGYSGYSSYSGLTQYLSQDAIICRYTQSTTSGSFFHGSTCNPTILDIQTRPPSSCKYHFVSITDGSGNLVGDLGSGWSTGWSSGSSTTTGRFQLDLTKTTLGEGYYKVNLHCSSDTNLDATRDRIKESLRFYLAKSYAYGDKTYPCQCVYSGTAFTGVYGWGINNLGTSASSYKIMPNDVTNLYEGINKAICIPSGNRCDIKKSSQFTVTDKCGSNCIKLKLIAGASGTTCVNGREYWMCQGHASPVGTTTSDENIMYSDLFQTVAAKTTTCHLDAVYKVLGSSGKSVLDLTCEKSAAFDIVGNTYGQVTLNEIGKDFNGKNMEYIIDEACERQKVKAVSCVPVGIPCKTDALCEEMLKLKGSDSTGVKCGSDRFCDYTTEYIFFCSNLLQRHPRIERV